MIVDFGKNKVNPIAAAKYIYVLFGERNELVDWADAGINPDKLSKNEIHCIKKNLETIRREVRNFLRVKKVV